MKNHRLLIITIVGIVAAIASPYLFTRCSQWLGFDFTEKGQIGDTIGGLTAPVIGLLNAVLLYWTLKRQDEQIVNQKNEISAQEIRDKLQLDQIKEQVAQQQEQLRERRAHDDENKFQAVYERKMDIIREKINASRFTVKMEDENSRMAPSLPNGEYRGELAFAAAMAMFSDTGWKLSSYDVNIVEWHHLMSNARTILLESLYIAARNNKRRAGLDSQNETHSYLIYHIGIIMQLDDAICYYAKGNRGERLLMTLHLQSGPGFKNLIEKIYTFNPDNASTS